jgi:very-short-patch-repair endonuclease
LRTILLGLEREDAAKQRGGRWHLIEDNQASPVSKSPPPKPQEAPTGIDLIRSICKFHADVIHEIGSSKVEFEDGDQRLKQQVRASIDWHKLSRGEVAVSRRHLPPKSQLTGKERLVFCGPLHRVEKRKRGGGTEEVWLPVFLIRATPVRRPTEVLLQLDGEVDVNLAWIEEMYSQGAEDLLEDTLIRLGMLHESAPGVLEHVPVKNLGACWQALEENVPEHEWVKTRNLLAPAEEFDPRAKAGLGIHPHILLIEDEHSPFMKGLVQDLRDIAKAPDQQLGASALSTLIHGSGSTAPSQSPTLVEFSPLNPIQSEAVSESFQAPLTVIQGPPGTGKSTVVRSALLTLGMHGQSALFCSTNHKAVDAVVGKMNEVTDFGSLVADLRRQGGRGKTWIAHLLKHLDAGRSAEGLDIAAFRKGLSDTEKAIQELLESTRATLEEGDRMVELQERIAELGEELGEWSQRPGDRRLPFPADQARLQLEAHASESWWKRVIARIWLRRRLGKLQKMWQGESPPSSNSLMSLLRVRLDQLELADLEKRIQQAPSLDDQADTLVNLVESKTDAIESVLGQLPAAWAGRIRDKGAAISELRRESQGRGKAGATRLAQVEQSRLPELLPGLPLWTVTSLSVRSTVPQVAAAFDLAVIDEAGQCNPASILPVLFRAKRALFVGDPQQLRPIGSLAHHKEEFLRRKHGLEGKEFSRFTFSGRSAYELAHDALIEREGNSFLLREHYRCHPAIAEFFNEHYYDGELIVRTTGRNEGKGRQGLTWTHVEGGSQTYGLSRWHPEQVTAIVNELVRLAKRGFDGSVGVVTPFREHAKRIRDTASREVGPEQLGRWSFISETADGFQGGEKDLILFGLVGGGEGKSATPPFYSRDRNRFNVAVSRAKHHLHIFGDENWARDCGVQVLADLLRAAVGFRSSAAGDVKQHLVGPVWEPRLADDLRARGIEFAQQYPAQGYYLDFAFFPSDRRKVNVEVDGETYHRDRDGNLRAEDVRRDLVLRADGWTVQRFWVYELRDDWEACIRRIQSILESPDTP